MHNVDEPVCTFFTLTFLNKKAIHQNILMPNLLELFAICFPSQPLAGEGKMFSVTGQWRFGTCLLLFFCSSLKIRREMGIAQGMDFFGSLFGGSQAGMCKMLFSLLRLCSIFLCIARLKTLISIYSFLDEVVDIGTGNVQI